MITIWGFLKTTKQIPKNGELLLSPKRKTIDEYESEFKSDFDDINNFKEAEKIEERDTKMGANDLLTNMELRRDKENKPRLPGFFATDNLDAGILFAHVNFFNLDKVPVNLRFAPDISTVTVYYPADR